MLFYLFELLRQFFLSLINISIPIIMYNIQYQRKKGAMNLNEQIPLLGQEFDDNPLLFMQQYVRRMDNSMLLSEYHINTFYGLLLLNHSYPWDEVKFKSGNEDFREQMDTLADRKINEVKIELEKLSEDYEMKVRKNASNQMQIHMSIIRARNKSIFIQKCPDESGKIQEQNKSIEEKCLKDQRESSEWKVFGIFSGLSRVMSISPDSLGDWLDYSPSERSITYRMNKNYIATIQNRDPIPYDNDSLLSPLPADLYVNHIFTYLTAEELFSVRSVCKEWLRHVKQTWHSTFKREMYFQLLVSEFRKDLEFCYKCFQLRDPLYQKLSVLMHAIIEIIDWNQVILFLESGTISLKRVALVLLKILGQDIQFDRVFDLNEELWQAHKDKIYTLKQKSKEFVTSYSNTTLSINQLKHIKRKILDHSFLQGESLENSDKSAFLLLVFVKQLTLQQIVKHHLDLGQHYIFNTKDRVDVLKKKMPRHNWYLEGVYKILLLKGFIYEDDGNEEQSFMPGFEQMVDSVFSHKETTRPDFTIKTRTLQTDIYMDRETRLDIIFSMLHKLKRFQGIKTETEQQLQKNPSEND